LSSVDNYTTRARADVGLHTVWNPKRLRAFLSSRLRNSEAITPLLWRCLLYNAHFPFTTPASEPEDNAALDQEAWMQAVTLLASRAVRHVGRNRATLSPYEGSSPASEKRCIWRRFISFASHARDSAGAAAGRDADDWHPPDSLDEVAMVVATQLPLDMKIKIPAYQDIRPKIVKLDDGSAQTSETAVGAGVIPYHEFVALLEAIMRIRHQGSAMNESGVKISWPDIDFHGDGDVEDAVALAILKCGGICAEGKDISFEQYAAFCDRFVSPTCRIGGIDLRGHAANTAHA
jgi:hypothetical protein